MRFPAISARSPMKAPIMGRRWPRGSVRRGRKVLGHRRFEALVAFAKSKLAKDGVLHPNHHLFEEYMGRGLCRIDHARNRLGYAPEFDLERGLEATADHLQAMKR